MSHQARLLLPFTGGIETLALSYALQMAEQRQAILVALALIPVKPDKGVRLERIQQSHDFLELVLRKAARCGVSVETVQLYTPDATLCIESFATEMKCEATLLFLSNAREVLLNHAEIRALVEHTACNMHIVLLPAKKRGWRRKQEHPLVIPLFKHAEGGDSEAPSDDLGKALLHRLMKPDNF